MFGIQIEEVITKYQTLQIPIFKRLIESNEFLKDYEIAIDDQYISIEKKYDSFWINIEIGDVESFEDIRYYDVKFMRHENSWLPSDENEEMESYPIKSWIFYDIESLKNFIEKYNV